MVKKIVLPAFVLMVLVQWYVPARLVVQMQHLLKTGKEFRFRTLPINPDEPVYGNTVYLSFKETSAHVSPADTFYTGDPVFVSLDVDSAGYAKISAVSKEMPSGATDFVRATVDYALGDSTGLLYVRYPFDQLYLEQPGPKPEDGSVSFWEPDTNQVSFALVMVHEGQAALKDVMINGESLKERRKRK